MRRAARLFEIIQILRRGSVFRAQELAAMLEVSERTIYRDIGHMVASGVPIDGAAGVGYILRPGFELPPLMSPRRRSRRFCWVHASSSRGPIPPSPRRPAH